MRFIITTGPNMLNIMTIDGIHKMECTEQITFQTIQSFGQHIITDNSIHLFGILHIKVIKVPIAQTVII